MPDSEDWIQIAFVKKAHGIQGALTLGLLNPESDILRVGLELLFRPSSRVLKIEKILGGHRIFLESIHTRNEAETLLRSTVWVRRSDFLELESDEVYLNDLIGFEAFDLKGRRLGEVTGFSDNSAQVLVEIADKTLVPFVKPILVQVQEDNQKIIFDLPEGFEF